jgi:carboxylate-amine ligase
LTPPDTPDFTIGIEEEYQIVDRETRGLRPRSDRVLPAAEESLHHLVQPELYLSQIETATPVCDSLQAARQELVRLRRGVIEAASRENASIAAAGTHPFSHWDEQRVTPKDRYRGIVNNFQQTARELVICGCHVHVGMQDRTRAVDVLNRIRPWLAPLLALSASSPFWLGADSGYASFRTQLWNTFPMSGPPQLFSCREEYEALVRALLTTGAIQDATRIYWDVRIPERVETIEIRVADVCTTVDEAITIAGLARGLVRTCFEAGLRNEPFPRVRPELLRAAHWQASRYGLEADLIDVEAERPVPAQELVERLLCFVRPALEDWGDWEEVWGLTRAVLQNGNSATRQRRAYEQTGRFEDVVDLIVCETRMGTELQEE